MDFNVMIQTWIKVLTNPGEAVFAEERQQPHANLTTALIWVAIAGVAAAIFGAMGAVVDSFFGGSASLLSSFGSNLPPELAPLLAQTGGSMMSGIIGACAAIIIVPLGFLIGAAIYFGIAKLVGGTGSFEEHTYILATIAAPIIVITSVIGVIPFLGDCVSFLVGIYQIVLTYYAMKVVHNLSTGMALVVVLVLPILAILCVVCILGVAFAGVFGAAASGGF